MKHHTRIAWLVAVGVCLTGGLLARAHFRAGEDEKERVVKDSEVPAAAMAALKKVVGSAKLTRIQEEIEHGHTFYEGQYAGPDGKVDVLVTATGDLVEIEEIVSADKVPAAVRAAATKAAGADAKLVFEKKTAISYETHFKKDGKHHELVLWPTGDRYHEEAEKGGDKDDDGDED